MTECVICGKPVPKERKKKDTCSMECVRVKVLAWATYLRRHKKELLANAIAEWKEQRRRT